jgi:hypothetical protein
VTLLSINDTKLRKLIAIEFWLKDRLVTPCCVVYIGTDDERYWKLLYNDETMPWELEASAFIPETGSVEGDEEFRYIAINLGERLGITNQTIIDTEERDCGDSAEFVVHLGKGTTVTFSHHYQSDEQSVKIASDT